METTPSSSKQGDGLSTREVWSLPPWRRSSGADERLQRRLTRESTKGDLSRSIEIYRFPRRSPTPTTRLAAPPRHRLLATTMYGRFSAKGRVRYRPSSNPASQSLFRPSFCRNDAARALQPRLWSQGQNVVAAPVGGG